MYEFSSDTMDVCLKSPMISKTFPNKRDLES